MKRLPAATSEFVNLINLHRKLRTRLLWDTFQLILEGKEMMRNDETSNGSLSSPQWSHLFPKTGASVIESFPLIIQAVRYKTQNMLHISPYEVKSQWNFQDRKWFNVTIVLKSKASTNRSTPNPLPLLHPYLDFSSHFLRFAGKLFELLRHNGKTLLLPLCFGRTNSETVNSKDFLQHVFFFDDVLTIGLWSSKFIEALDMPNSWGIPKGSEQVNGRDAYQKCCKLLATHGSSWVHVVLLSLILLSKVLKSARCTCSSVLSLTIYHFQGSSLSIHSREVDNEHCQNQAYLALKNNCDKWLKSLHLFMQRVSPLLKFRCSDKM